MVSFTTPVFTQTQTRNPEIIHVQLKKSDDLAQNVQTKLDALHASFYSSKLFSTDQLEQIDEWRAEFDDQSSSIISTDAERAQSCDDLCFLLCEIIRPMTTEEEEDDRLIKLFAFEKEIMDILSMILPTMYSTPEECIEHFERVPDSITALQKLAATDSFTQHEKQRVSSLADRTNTLFEETFKNQKDGLQEVHQYRMSLSRKAGERLDLVNEKLISVSEETAKVMKRGDAEIQRFVELQVSIKETAQGADDLFTKVLK